jgi:hypothetical protein
MSLHWCSVCRAHDAAPPFREDLDESLEVIGPLLLVFREGGES